MIRDLSRLLRPRSIAVIGGGAWARAVVEQCRRMEFAGAVWPVNPKGGETGGLRVYEALSTLPAPPDAAFVGVNRQATVEVVAGLAAMGAGGAVCFAAGFAESAAEDADGGGLQAALVAAAGAMPILGPNCYGVINALDGALLWPDQQGCVRVDRGVAILTQSSNIAINLTMQRRGLPVAYVVTCGNMAQTGQAAIARTLLDDDRVTAIGLHVEGFRDLRDWEALAGAARARGVPLVALKVGRSTQAQAATVSHTASLAGQDAGAAALMQRLGIARVDTLATFLETLKLCHVCGPLASNRVASISCSGGEASLMADLGAARGLVFPPLGPVQTAALRDALGPRVALANPLDYNTYAWRDTATMTRAWAALMAPDLALTFTVVDYPRDDRCDPADWRCATDAAKAARAETGRCVAVVASLPELMPEAVAAELMAAGVAPLSGMAEALDAAAAAAWLGAARETAAPVLLPGPVRPARSLGEAASKALLAGYGLDLPRRAEAGSPEAAADAASGIGFPVALKGQGFDHKTEAGVVALGLGSAADVLVAARAMPADRFLAEEMIVGAVAEVIVGVVKDPAHGFVLTLGAGGVLAELLEDRVCLLVPASEAAVTAALGRLKVARLLAGWRGKPAGNCDAVVAAVMAVQRLVMDRADRIEEVEVNPLIVTPTRAVAVDALIREAAR